jgi:hypothetical protein
LPHYQATFYPLGSALTVDTNSLQILDIARQEWGAWTQIFEAAAVVLEIEVSDHEAPDMPPPVVFHAGRNLLRWTADEHNHAAGDPVAGTARATISSTAASDPAWLLYHFLDAMAYQLLGARHFAPVHASCVAREGRGALLCGDSKAGKTSLAYACARAGWTYVSDDASWLVRRRAEERVVVGSPHFIRLRPDATRFFPELAGRPVLRRGNGKAMLRIVTHDLPISTAPAASIDRMVFLRRVPGSPARLMPLAREEMRTWCEQVFYTWNPEIAAEQHAALGMLLDGSRIETLEYSDLEAAVDALG